MLTVSIYYRQLTNNTHNMTKRLTELEYSVVMQAISNARAEIADQNFIDPYANEDNHTHTQLAEALDAAETKLIAQYTKKRLYAK